MHERAFPHLFSRAIELSDLNVRIPIPKKPKHTSKKAQQKQNEGRNKPSNVNGKRQPVVTIYMEKVAPTALAILCPKAVEEGDRLIVKGTLTAKGEQKLNEAHVTQRVYAAFDQARLKKQEL